MIRVVVESVIEGEKSFVSFVKILDIFLDC